MISPLEWTTAGVWKLRGCVHPPLVVRIASDFATITYRYIYGGIPNETHTRSGAEFHAAFEPDKREQVLV